MDRDFWLNKWQVNDIGFNQAAPNILLQRYLPNLNLQAGKSVLVPLCGKSIDMLWLATQGYRVIGVELSPAACEAFFIENQLPYQKSKMGDFILYESESIRLIAGDFFQISPAMIGSVDAVYDRAALVALPPAMRERYAAYLTPLLQRPAQMLLITTAYDQSLMPGPPFSVDAQEVTRLYGQHFRVNHLYDKPLKVIPPHLLAKGMAAGAEQVFHLRMKES